MCLYDGWPVLLCLIQIVGCQWGGILQRIWEDVMSSPQLASRTGGPIQKKNYNTVWWVPYKVTVEGKKSLSYQGLQLCSVVKSKPRRALWYVNMLVTFLGSLHVLNKALSHFSINVMMVILVGITKKYFHNTSLKLMLHARQTLFLFWR